MEKIGIIGGGITGIFSALNLSMNGYKVTVFERNSLLAGTSGRFHGMLHSGARYSVNDPNSARECMGENKLLSKTASRFIKDTGGYYISLGEVESNYGDMLIKSNEKNGIDSEELPPEEFLKMEAYVNPKIERVIRVPDKIISAHNFSAAVALEAIMAGTKFNTGCNVVGGSVSKNNVISLKYSYNGNIQTEKFDFIINTSGPWSGNVAQNLGIKNFEVMPTLGYMAVYDRPFVGSIINRMRPPSDGDIILPYGSGTVAGTLAIISDDPDSNDVDDEDLDIMLSEVSKMVPSLEKKRYKKLYYSMRPLVKDDNSRGTRDFSIIDNFDNMISIIGGKFTTTRLMASELSNRISEIFGSHNYDTSKINFNDTFERYMESNMGGLDKEFINYINSYRDGMDFEYADYILSAYLLNEGIKRGNKNEI
jgi:glycerol-3-phosphate dehydrogenase